MLRASSETIGMPLDPRAITDSTVDPLTTGGTDLLRFVDAVLGRGGVEEAGAQLEDSLGRDAVVDAAGVVANFEMMNRIAEGTGIPVGKGSLARTKEWRSMVGLDRYRHD